MGGRKEERRRRREKSENNIVPFNVYPSPCCGVFPLTIPRRVSRCGLSQSITPLCSVVGIFILHFKPASLSTRKHFCIYQLLWATVQLDI